MTTHPKGSVSHDSSALSTRDLPRDLPARRHFATATHLERAMRRVLGVAVALMVMPDIALAQPPGQPIVEPCAQVSKRTGDSGPVGQESAPPPTAWRLVKPGREVWVTTNTGSLVHGKVVAISDSSLNIREQGREVTIRLDDVRLVEGRDSKKNGLAIGGTSAAVAGGLFFSRLATELCEGGQECGGDTGGAFLLGAASGFVVGGLLGMMVDALIPGRQTLFGSSTTVVTPVITPERKSIDVAIRLR
jgi:hypothetical protein